MLEGLDEVDYFDEVTHWAKAIQKPAIARNYQTCLSRFRSGVTSMRVRKLVWARNVSTSIACFITRMRQRALDADIVVVNHHLFFADLALRNSMYGSVLPDYSAVILDEAHLIEDVASEYFGAQISNYQIDDLIRDVGDAALSKTPKRIAK